VSAAVRFEEWWRRNHPGDSGFGFGKAVAEAGWKARQAEIDRLRAEIGQLKSDVAALRKEADLVAYVGTVEGYRAIYFTREPVDISMCPHIAEAVEDVDRFHHSEVQS
jgi:hypothetical protein